MIEQGQISSEEFKFKQKKALKRNKKIFDVERLNSIQSNQQVRRRIPSSGLSQQADDKFKVAFLDSTATFSSKRDQQIDKYKRRVSSGIFERYKTQEMSKSIDSMKNSQEKSRKNKRQLTQNESRFNNYSGYVLKPDKIRDFDKYLNRKQSLKEESNKSSINYDKIKQTYEKITHNSAKFKCKWQYKLQKAQKEPSYIPKKKYATQIPQQKIDQGRQKITAHWKKVQNQFKKQLSMNVQSQFNRTYDNRLKNWRAFIEKTPKDYQGVKYKVAKFKNAQFQRTQLCDIKYFRIQVCKQKRLNS